ncbi:MAG: DUF5667 domain-containing protein, partial [Actinomycetota bacterium]|nr:DUF5667 domain-containing protein [Actinomycetota bacterium]
MSALLSTRRKAEEFARALEQPGAAGTWLEPLLQVAGALRSAGDEAPQPGEHFRADLRERLLAAASTELMASRSEHDAWAVRGFGRVPVDADVRGARTRRRLVAAASGLVLVGGGAGVASASQHALPGEMLYPIKRALESIELTLAGGPAEEGRVYIEQASSRLDEVQALSADGVTDVELGSVEQSLTEFVVDAEHGGQLLIDAYRDSGDEADLVVLRTFTAESAAELAALADQLPPEVSSLLAEASETVDTIDTQALQVCPECTPGLSAVLADADLMSLRYPTHVDTDDRRLPSAGEADSSADRPATAPAGLAHQDDDAGVQGPVSDHPADPTPPERPSEPEPAQPEPPLSETQSTPVEIVPEPAAAETPEEGVGEDEASEDIANSTDSTTQGTGDSRQAPEIEVTLDTAEDTVTGTGTGTENLTQDADQVADNPATVADSQQVTREVDTVTDDTTDTVEDANQVTREVDTVTEDVAPVTGNPATVADIDTTRDNTNQATREVDKVTDDTLDAVEDSPTDTEKLTQAADRVTDNPTRVTDTDTRDTVEDANQVTREVDTVTEDTTRDTVE